MAPGWHAGVDSRSLPGRVVHPPQAHRRVRTGRGQTPERVDRNREHLVALHLPAIRVRPAGSAVLVALLVASLLPLPAAGAAPRTALPVVGGALWAGVGGQGSSGDLGVSSGEPTSPAQLTPSAAHVAMDRARGGTPAVPADLPDGVRPSAMYEQAMAHAGDRIAFAPGDRVTVGYTPRATDRWPVGGSTPVALPAGRATGHAMAAEASGDAWAETGDGAGDPVATADPVATEAAPTDPSSIARVAPTVATATTTTTTTTRRQVFGFLPYWELPGATSKLNFDVLSTVAYFSVGVDSRGNLRKTESDGSLTTGWAGWTSSNMTSVINQAHQDGTRVVLTITAFAWTTATATIQKNLLGSATARANLAQQIAAAVRDRGADGVNLDFEPISTGYEDEFVALVQSVRAELNKVRAGYQLTFDTTGWIGNYPIERLVAAGAADAVFIMGYDYRTSGSGVAGSIDPLTGTGYDLTDTVRAYTSRVPASKVILGLPWYGRAWSTTGETPRSQNRSGLQYGYSTAVNYETVVDLVAQYGRRWDAAEQTPYVAYQRQNCTSTYGCVTSWRQVYYDDEESTALRLALVNTYGLRGAGMWALGYDGGNPELYRAFANTLVVDKTAPQAGITVLATTQVNEGFKVGWSTPDPAAVASYDLQASVDGGGWTDWLAATTATSAIYQGADGHGYAFRVRARDAKGNAGAWNVTSTFDATPALGVGGFARVVPDALGYRTGPGTSATRIGTVAKGTLVAITRGPVVADGYTWYEVTQPISEWSPVGFVERGVWMAASSGTTAYLTAVKAPNATRVGAGISGLDFGTAVAAGAGIGLADDAVAARTFSPNADGVDETLRIRWTNEVALETLTLNAYLPDGALAGTTPVAAISAGPHAWTWNGRFAGATLPDGTYVLQLVGTVAGRTYSAPSAAPWATEVAAPYAITVDTVAPVVTAAAASAPVVSPNGDARFDTVDVSQTAPGAIRWAASVTSGAAGDAAGAAVVHETSGDGETARLTWNGLDEREAPLPDGPYTVTVTSWDLAGNRVTRGYPVTVDTVAPAILPALSRPAFSPDGDGAADTVGLTFTAGEAGTGSARIYSGTRPIRAWPLSAATAWAQAWDGRTAAGAAVPDGVYTYRVVVRDAAGNLGMAELPIVIDRTGGWLRWSASFFPQDRDALAVTSTLTYRLAASARTTLTICDAAGVVVAAPWTDKAQAAGTKTWRWDGKRADGTLVPQGRYTARLTVVSTLGTMELVRNVVVAAFAVTPLPATVTAGQTLKIAFGTVEQLATRPTITFTQAGLAGVTVTATRLANGSYTASFRVAAGGAGAATLRIVAKDAYGRLNATVVAVTVAP